MSDSNAEVRQVLQRFQDGYSTCDMANLDEFMKLFVPGDEAELIGIGASVVVLPESLANRMYIGSSDKQDLQAQAVIDEFVIREQP